jgi:hypothetical protein
MRIRQPANKKNRIIKYSLISIVVLALIAAGVFYTLKLLSRDQDSDANGPTTAQKKEMQAVDNAKKKEFAENTKDIDNPGTTVPTPTSPDTIDLSASKTDASTVTIFTKLKNYASGTCELTITNGPKTYPNTADILYQPEYSTCAGFSVPLSELGSGTWTIKLTATPTGANPVAKTINLEVQ